jgi:hypothetical protein
LEKVALLEDRNGLGETPRMLRQPTEPEANRATHRPGTDSFHLGRAIRSRSDTSFAQRLHEPAHQERHPPGRTEAGLDEDWIRGTARLPRNDRAPGGHYDDHRRGRRCEPRPDRPRCRTNRRAGGDSSVRRHSGRRTLTPGGHPRARALARVETGVRRTHRRQPDPLPDGHLGGSLSRCPSRPSRTEEHR